MKQKKQIIFLAVLLVILAGVGYSYLQGDKQSVSAEAVPAAQAPPPLIVGDENLQLHDYAVDRSQKTEYKSSGRNIFTRVIQQPIPKPNPGPKPGEPGSPGHPIDPLPPPPPQARPIPAKFYGFGVVPNGTRRLAFFSSGDDTYIVAEGEILLKSFRILRINSSPNNTNLDYEDMSNGVQGICQMEEQGVASSSNP